MSRPILHHGDAVEWAARYEGERFHAMICDPPYHLTQPNIRNAYNPTPGLSSWDAVHEVHKIARAQNKQGASTGFMNAKWDGGDVAFRPETWAAFLPLLHPGAWCMAFAGSRGWHRMACAIEDAGFVFHPSIFMWGWAYGSGFTKATNIGKQLREDRHGGDTETKQRMFIKSAISNAAMQGISLQERAYILKHERAYSGHRYSLQCLKPALEPIIVFQKPYAGRPVESMVATGAGALNIAGGRIGSDQVTTQGGDKFPNLYGTFATAEETTRMGRWPANLILQHHPDCTRIGTRRVRGGSRAGQSASGYDVRGVTLAGSIDGSLNTMKSPGYADADGFEEVDAWQCVDGCPVARLSAQSGELTSGALDRSHITAPNHIYGQPPADLHGTYEPNAGTAARFYYNADYAAERLEAADPVRYCPKSSTSEREAGLSGRQRQIVNDGRDTPIDNPYQRGDTQRLNLHPTLKPLSLVRHLATLLLPPALYAPRRLFVPFAGVGSECIGAEFAGWEHIEGVELEQEHVDIGLSRIEWWHRMMEQTHSTDIDAILARYGRQPKAAPQTTAWPAGSLFADMEDE